MGIFIDNRARKKNCFFSDTLLFFEKQIRFSKANNLKDYFIVLHCTEVSWGAFVEKHVHFFTSELYVMTASTSWRASVWNILNVYEAETGDKQDSDQSRGVHRCRLPLNVFILVFRPPSNILWLTPCFPRAQTIHHILTAVDLCNPFISPSPEED